MGSIRISDKSQNVVNTSYQAPVSPLSTPAAAHEHGPSVAAVKQPTVNLFQQSSYQNAAPITLADGQTFSLPTSSAEDAQTFNSLFANVPDEHKESLNAASAQLAAAVLAYVQQNPSQATSTDKQPAGATSAAASVLASESASTSSVGNAPSVSRLAVGGVSKYGGSLTNPTTQSSAPVVDNGPATTWEINQASPNLAGVRAANSAAKSTYSTATGNGDFDQNVQAAAYMGVQGMQQGLQQYANMMSAQTNKQKTLREDQSELNQAVAGWDPTQAKQNFTWHEVDSNGNLQSYTASLSQSEAKAKAENLGSTLSQMGSDQQMMQIQLQTMMQNYQQGVTTISNMMKMQYDMVKNTIGNIHY